MSTNTRSEQLVQDAGQRLWAAARSGRPIRPVRDELGATDVDTAYAVQELLTLRRIQEGAKVVGRKIGLTSPAVQRQLGVDQPDFGVLFHDMLRREDDPIGTGRLIAPRIEAEVAFVLGADLDAGDDTVERIRAKIAHVQPALEIVDSRVQDWDISIVDTVADNASSALFVLGEQRTGLSGLNLPAVSMELRADGQVVSSGNGSACLGDPLNAVLWLARTCQRLGLPLKAGEVVLSGALGPMVAVQAGTVYRAEISSLGAVTARFAAEGTP